MTTPQPFNLTMTAMTRPMDEIENILNRNVERSALRVDPVSGTGMMQFTLGDSQRVGCHLRQESSAGVELHRHLVLEKFRYPLQ